LLLVHCFGRISFIVPTTHILIVVAFIFEHFSALAGNMGMKIATKTNVRTTQAARTSLPQALKVSLAAERNGIRSCRFSGFRIDYFFYIFLPLFMNGV
jgi:K(+)-stimulated pyrophosphate-energized sodium pump